MTIDDPDNLNPALAEARFCPRCGAPDLAIAFPRSLHCAACGHRAFYNPKPVASGEVLGVACAIASKTISTMRSCGRL